MGCRRRGPTHRAQRPEAEVGAEAERLRLGPLEPAMPEAGTLDFLDPCANESISSLRQVRVRFL